jgi:Mg-chelatase subunit ChlD
LAVKDFPGYPVISACAKEIWEMEKKRWVEIIFFTAAALAVGLLLLNALLPQPAWAWGSTTSSPLGRDFATHQFIYREAYNCLQALPGFSRDKFPELAEILADEGNQVSVTGSVTGAGPDAEGSSQYSSHWYNPRTSEGGAPMQVYELMKTLARGMIEARMAGAAAQPAARQRAVHGAAWGSHFFVDMFTPYHVIGTTEANARSWAGRSPIILAEAITGVPPGGRDWSNEVGRFIAASDAAIASGSGHVDWFDPWYWDSRLTTGNSTHAAWEERNPQHVTRFTCNTGFDPNWANGAPSFSNYHVAYGAQAKKYAEAAADMARSQMQPWITNPEPAVDAAVQNLFTLWRGSFSLLEPTMEISTKTDAAGKKVLLVKGKIKNPLDEDASSGLMKLTVSQGQVTAGDETQDIGMIDRQSDKTEREAKWEIEVSATADAQNPCRLKLEVCAAFARTPDLQYAACEQELKNVENSIVILIDCSGSMQGKKIENAKMSAQRTIDAMDEKTEVAVITFSNCPGSIGVMVPFTIVIQASQAEIKNKIAAISAGGMTPLARAVAFAGDYLRRQASGKNLNLIVLSDGEETCEKPDAPAAAVRNMNQ